MEMQAKDVQGAEADQDKENSKTATDSKVPASKPKEECLLPPCMMSPGPSKTTSALNAGISTPIQRKNPHSSPFREWAHREWGKSALSTFDNDMFSPSKSMLSPITSLMKMESSPAIRVRVKDEMRSDGPDCPLVKSIGPLAICFESEFTQKNDAASSLTHDKVECIAKGTPRRTIINEDSDSTSSSTSFQPKAPSKFRLQFVDLFTFEIFDEKVSTTGFSECEANDASFLKVRKPLQPLPATPGFGQDPDKMRLCSCKKSRCLKLYCECFAASELCRGCKCMDCANDGRHEAEREDAVDRIKQRSVNAFAPKIVEEVRQDKSVHARGCRCKKSHCLKKYCECYQAGVRCGDNCKCEDCHNISASANFTVTPRERRPAADLATMMKINGSPIERYVTERSHGSRVVHDDEEDEGDSPCPRSKKPRMLDFNVASTPTRNSCVLEQDSPGPRMEGFGMYNSVFGSPSCLFIPN